MIHILRIYVDNKGESPNIDEGDMIDDYGWYRYYNEIIVDSEIHPSVDGLLNLFINLFCNIAGINKGDINI